MPEKQLYCPRCAKPAVRGDSATEEIWRCPTQHGIVHKAPLSTPPETQAAASPEPPPGEYEDDAEPPAEKDQDEEKEDAKPEARARAPAAHHRPPPAKNVVRTMPKKK
jgi:hypothetical protein